MIIRTTIILFALSSAAYAQFGGGGGGSVVIAPAPGGGGGGPGPGPGPTNPAPPDSTLGQYETGGGAIPTGGNAAGTTVVFKAINNNTTFGDLQLEVEVRPVGETFLNLGTCVSAPAAPGAEASVLLDDISWNAAFHWRARWIGGTGSGPSSWVEGPQTSPNGSGEVDFVVIAAPPGFGSAFHSTVGWTLTNGASDGTGWGVDGDPAGLPAPGGPFLSGTTSLNYNNGFSYDSGAANSGTALSPAFDVSSFTSPVLQFWCNHEVQDTGVQFDQRWVSILDGVTMAVLYSEQLSVSGGQCDVFGAWHLHEVPLDASWGTVRVELCFDTVDSLSNGFPGWFVDDMATVEAPVGGGPGAGGAPAADRDSPNGDTNIFETICSAGACGTGSGSSRPVLMMLMLAALLAALLRLNGRP